MEKNNELAYVVESIIEELEELKNESDSEFVAGQRLAYATMLGRAKEMLSLEAKEYGLDFDVDATYLYVPTDAKNLPGEDETDED